MIALYIFFYVGLMLLIGLYVSRKVKNTNDYVLAGRSLPFYMALATVFATWFGSESILGASSKFAEGGISNVLEDPFGAALCLIIAGIFFNRKLYRLKFLTIGDYFKNRYNTLVATFLSVVIIISYFGWVAAQFLALGIVVAHVFNISLYAAVVLSAVFTILYTYFGGMMSVAWLDTIQTCVIIVGLILILFYAMTHIGNFEALLSTMPPKFLSPFPEGMDFNSFALALTALMTIGFGSIPQQDIYQRAMSAKSENISVWASVFGGLLYFTIVLIPLCIGYIASVLYPEILATNAQDLIPHLVENIMPPWLQAVFFGALISAILSTASGALLAPSTLLAENVIKPFFREIDDRLRLLIIRFSVLLIAVVSISMALADNAHIYELVSGAYSVTLVAGFIPLAFGLYSSRSNSLGAFVSILAGIGAWQIAESVGTELPPTLIGFVFSLGGMLIGSFVFRFIGKAEKII
jgi:SSS family transporter